jgi:uncharacterized repeat protein (TIGR03809 family)
MTHRIDVALSRDIVARWCAFAEQRLEYLTELFETGRWRRFYSERAFLENIREAKTAVETWRGLVRREASPGTSAAVSWPAEIPVDSPPFDLSIATQAERVCSDETPSAPDVDTRALNVAALDVPPLDVPPLEVTVLNDTPEWVPNLDAIAERYPLLRNAL